MTRKSASLVSGIMLLALAVTFSGCTQARQAGRPDPDPEIAVRFPATESPNVSLRAEEPPKTPGETTLPNDEIHRPWLKAIEVTVTPGEPGPANAPAEPAK